jgi:hypothetical protein
LPAIAVTMVVAGCYGRHRTTCGSYCSGQLGALLQEVDRVNIGVPLCLFPQIVNDHVATLSQKVNRINIRVPLCLLLQMLYIRVLHTGTRTAATKQQLSELSKIYRATSICIHPVKKFTKPIVCDIGHR